MSTTTTRVGRRTLLSAIAAAPAAIAAPAIAQTTPQIKWRLVSSFPKTFEAMYGSAQLFINSVRELTSGGLELQWFGPGEIVPALGVVQAVQTGTVEMGQTPPFYYFGMDPAFAFGTGIPFGMNSRGFGSWLVQGGGIQLLDELYSKFNVVGLFAGDTGTHAFGWFRREIKSADDLKGMKIRIAGLSGVVLSEAGAVPQQIPLGETYPALERGTLDAAKLISPIDDEKLGLAKVAPFYYWPGWNDPTGGVFMFINQQKWESLPKSYQSALRASAVAAGQFMQTRYDFGNARALRQLISQGAQLRFLPNGVIEKLSEAATKVYGDLSAKSPSFAKLYESYSSFSRDAYSYFRVSELSYDAMRANLYSTQR